MQNLVGIDAVVSIICECCYLTCLASKCLLTPQTEVLGDFTLTGEQSYRDPTFLCRSTSYDLQIVKIGPPFCTAYHYSIPEILCFAMGYTFP